MRTLRVRERPLNYPTRERGYWRPEERRFAINQAIRRYFSLLIAVSHLNSGIRNYMAKTSLMEEMDGASTGEGTLSHLRGRMDSSNRCHSKRRYKNSQSLKSASFWSFRSGRKRVNEVSQSFSRSFNQSVTTLTATPQHVVFTFFEGEKSSSLLAMAQKLSSALAVVVILCFTSASVWCRSLEPAATGNSEQVVEPEVEDVGATTAVVVGACWQRIGDEGRCSGPFQHNVTKAECCAGNHLHIGWTPYTIQTELDYFQYVIVGRQAAGCQPCKTTCDNVNCGANRVCRVIRGRPQCICDPDCSGIPNLHSGPVCGFDGKTYRNHCSLIRYSCRHQQFLPIDYVGSCQYSCDRVRCDADKNCVVDQNGLPHCVSCMVTCPNATDLSERVCGGDGRTYASLCHLERQTCIRGRAIRLAYRSPCQVGKTCEEMSCGTDRCLMDERSSTPACVACDRRCPPGRARAALCGTDNVTHSSYCEMVGTSCSRGIVIETKHYGPCGWQPRSDQTAEQATEQDD